MDAPDGRIWSAPLPNPASVIDPELDRDGIPRASLGFSVPAAAAGACSPTLLSSRTPMILTVGSIYWKPEPLFDWLETLLRHHSTASENGSQEFALVGWRGLLLRSGATNPLPAASHLHESTGNSNA